jgi:hypothetical protein
MSVRVRHRAALLVVALIASSASAQSPAGPVLLGVDVQAADAGWRAEIRLDRQVRYLRHTPRSGTRVRVELDLLAPAGLRRGIARREALQAPPVAGSPLREVTWDATVGARPVLELRLAERADVRVSQGSELSSIIVSIVPAARRRERASPASATDDRLLVEARRAITEGELDRAVLLLRKAADAAAQRGDAKTAAAARELLGVLHERRGQRAHARAEYEEILAAWPDSEVASRVRQRLDALLAAQAPSREPLRESQPLDEQGFETELYGSLAASYRRFEAIDDVAGGRVFDSSGITDLNAVGRLESRSVVLRGEVVASYRYDFLERDRGEDTRVSTLLLRASDPARTLVATAGRQSRSSGGVLGRFDGAHLAYRVTERVTLSALAGLPLLSSAVPRIQTEESVFGAAIDVTRLPYDIDGELFIVAQRDRGWTDRVAIGGELRYARPGLFGLAFLDYDVYFQSLNTALVTGNITFANRTDLHLLVETRNAPVLTLGNALIGQTATDLDALHALFSSDEIRDLARDRTARSWTGSLGVTYRHTDRLQLGSDVTLTSVSSTPTSGGVLGTPSIGPETSFGVQATLSDFVRSGGFGTLSLRYYDGEFSDTTSVLTSARLPVTRDLRLSARVRADHRSGTTQRLTLTPSLRADWRVWQLVVDAELGLDWTEGLAGASGLDELGYFAELVVRWDF